MSWYGADAWALGPAFYCPLCVRQEKDLQRGCPKCELSQLLKIYQEEIKAEVEKRFGGFGKWSFDWLMRLYSDICERLKSNDGKVSRKWDVTTIELANIVLAERNQAKYEQSWEAWNKARNRK